MRAEPLDLLAESMIVDAAVAPAASLAIARRSRSGWNLLTGAAGTRSRTRPTKVHPETPFDLASVTKPLVAATIARRIRQGFFDWRTPLAGLLSETEGTLTGSAPLELLLSHRAGLDAHQHLYMPLTRGEAVAPAEMLAAAARARRPDCAGDLPGEGFSPLYSDLGYLLAGAAVERNAAASLREVVVGELSAIETGIDSAAGFLAGDSRFLEEVAPTEVVEWRGGEIVGAVHDENAWAFSRFGCAGHAGLFGTAAGVARFGMGFLDAIAGRRPEWLTTAEASVLIRERPQGTLRAGFDGKSSEGSAAGSAFGPRSFGHLGFTGTSLWCDPDADTVVVILTNRVNPTRDNISIRRARPLLNDALFGLAARLLAG